MLIFAFAVVLLSGCTHWSNSLIHHRDTPEERLLRQLATVMKAEDRQATASLFSEGYHSGYQALQQQIESGWQEKDLVELKFTIEEVRKTAGQELLQTAWRRTTLNRDGKPVNDRGRSEIIVKQTGDGFIILAIKGDSFF